jgi:RNA polymerase sigma-70 factor (ECF subfamily)
MSPGDVHPTALLRSARAGDDAALGRLLELYRNYLRLLARSVIKPTLRVRVDPSDLVQETFLKAAREFPAFAGEGEPELVVWLRTTLVRTLSDLVKFHRAKGRDLRREEPLDAVLDRSSVEADRALVAAGASPSAAAAGREQAVLLADAVARLPPDYREVFILRNMEHLPFDQVAARMGRSAGAVRILWTRAIARLGELLKEPP